MWDVAVPHARMTVEIAAHIIELRDHILLISKEANCSVLGIRVHIEQVRYRPLGKEGEQEKIAMIHEIATNRRSIPKEFKRVEM
ncbi:hypothetical protein CVT26_000512 [Gymnopilus dilepis]|uniref:Uncharacterized protein n=1 Tax=Gymnopilus dilepis TaxID=231916 RepID=A0A409YU69_9AGAR|nr:hypothetical protein CVT26_000512 [Gymnopilus dilepis]